MKRNHFVVNARLPSLNDYINACRTHWASGAKLKQETEELIMWSIRAAVNKGDAWPVDKPVSIAFIWHEHGTRRDLDNIYSAKKYVLDAMQKAGIIANDDRKHVYALYDHIQDAPAGGDKVEVVIMGQGASA